MEFNISKILDFVLVLDEEESLVGDLLDWCWLIIREYGYSFPEDVQVGGVGIDDGLADFGAWFQNAFFAHEIDVVYHGVSRTLQVFRSDRDRYDGIAFRLSNCKILF